MSLDTVRLGNTGLQVSELALGTARFGSTRDDGAEEIDRETAHDLLDTYASRGGNFVDLADAYGEGRAETYVGEWLRERDREEFVLASKIYWPTRNGDPNASGLNRKHLRRQVDNILDRLGTDYLDLLYIHRWDDETPVEEFMRTLDQFVSEGRVHYLGASNGEPNAWQVVKANETARRLGYEQFTNLQFKYNLVDRELERNVIPMAQEYGLGLMPFSPLGGGFLTGKYRRGEEPPVGSRVAREERYYETYLTEANFDILERAEAIAAECDGSVLQVSLAWLLKHPDVTSPVIGPRTVSQLESNLDSVDLTLTDEQFKQLDSAGNA